MSEQKVNRSRLAATWWSTWPNLVCHQIAWWICVLCMGLIGTGAMLLFIGAHLGLLRPSNQRELKLVLVSAIVGLCLDNILGAFGFVSYEGHYWIGFMPLWLLAIWAGFGATLRHGQKVLVKTQLYAALTGFLGGPLAYLGGEKLSRLDVQGSIGWFMVSVTWGAAMLILYKATNLAEGDVATE